MLWGCRKYTWFPTSRKSSITYLLLEIPFLDNSCVSAAYFKNIADCIHDYIDTKTLKFFSGIYTHLDFIFEFNAKLRITFIEVVFTYVCSYYSWLRQLRKSLTPDLTWPFLKRLSRYFTKMKYFHDVLLLVVSFMVENLS